MDRVARHYSRNSRDAIWQDVIEVLREELGAYRLIETRTNDAQREAETFFSHLATLEQALDTIELWHAFCRSRIYADQFSSSKTLNEATATINARLLENGIGFEILDGQIIEKANEFSHTEIILPALKILSEKRFQGANQEFRAAHAAYRAGEFKNCVADCLKALESVIKTIAIEKNWALPDNANAKSLIQALFDNAFIPTFMQSQFSSVRNLLESSVPTTRNRTSGHGQGSTIREIPRSMAAFQLHQTAAIIVFLSQVQDS
jgi:hypothetical protein